MSFKIMQKCVRLRCARRPHHLLLPSGGMIAAVRKSASSGSKYAPTHVGCENRNIDSDDYAIADYKLDDAIPSIIRKPR